MEDIDKNADGFIDLEEYIGELCLFGSGGLFSFVTLETYLELRSWTEGLLGMVVLAEPTLKNYLSTSWFEN